MIYGNHWLEVYLHTTAKRNVIDGSRLAVADAKVDDVCFNPAKYSALPNTDLEQKWEEHNE